MSRDILYPLRRLHGFLYETNLKHKKKRKLIKELIIPARRMVKEKKKVAFWVLTPEHGNLGDHAIAMSEIRLLHSLNIDFIEITGQTLGEMERFHLISCLDGAVILVHGGGFLGTLWYSAEASVRELLKNAPNSNIVLFPNTLYYDKTEWAEQEKRKSVQIYNRHKHLQLYARERYSYEIMSQLYNNVSLIPDMVLYLNMSQNQKKRAGCLLCLRSDREKTLSDSQQNIIVHEAHSLFGSDIAFTDMCVDHPVLPEERETELNKKFDEFLSARLVITDRLHGMIFSAITGTPCIVLESKSHKVRGCYEWIKSLPYIRFADTPEDISPLYRQIPDEVFHYNPDLFDEYYNSLSKQISDLFQTG